VYNYVMCHHPNQVVSHQPGRPHRKCQLTFKPAGYEIVLRELQHNSHIKRRAHSDSGKIYCFLAAVDAAGFHWLKVGKTYKPLRERLVLYKGPASVRRLLFQFDTDSMRADETKVVNAFAKRFERVNREWFKIPHERLAEAKRLFSDVFLSC